MMKNEAGVRIEEMLCQLADATRIDGEIWRAAYTLEDKIAKNILREWIEDMGLEYREDAIGNVYGRLPGTEPGTVLTGSHLDTVKNGGKYDGALGVVTGVAALGYLKQSGFVPKHSLEVAGLMEEEGSRFPSGCQGSRAICGTLKEEDLEELSRDGVTLREALVSAGYQTVTTQKPFNFRTSTISSHRTRIKPRFSRAGAISSTTSTARFSLSCLF